MSQQASDGRDGRQQQITWVGMQHLMHGYCGRACQALVATQKQPATTTGQAEPAKVRPVAVVRTKPRQARVVRVGPPRSAQPAA